MCSGISCMAQDCSLQMPEDFVLPLLPGEELKDKYRRYLFRDYVEVCDSLCVCSDTVSKSACIVNEKHLERQWELSWPICVCFESANVPHTAWNLTSFLYICLSHQLGIFVNANSYISIRQSFPAIIPSDDKEIHHQLKLITKVVLCQILVPTLEVTSLIVSLCFLQSHFQLQLCPGADCPMVIKVQEPRARRVQCSRCSEVFW